MKVKEVIEALQKVDPETLVMIEILDALHLGGKFSEGVAEAGVIVTGIGLAGNADKPFLVMKPFAKLVKLTLAEPVPNFIFDDQDFAGGEDGYDDDEDEPTGPTKGLKIPEKIEG